LKHLDLRLVNYGPEPINETQIRNGINLENLKSFNLEITQRRGLEEQPDPAIYNEHVFREWRRHLEEELIDLTNDID